MDKIGKYQILSKIGKGGMGVVYKARDPFLAREVAVKVMSEDLCAEPNFQDRFLREARVSVGLKHENIIDVYDLNEDHGLMYLAMEFLDGHDLRAELGSQKRIPLERKLQIMIGVCKGLGHAHAKGVIHRDIKPANIFITKAGLPKILDFGLARLASSELTHARSYTISDLSHQGDVMGTPAYMSPEQVRSEKVDERSDIYSCGVVFYELISGKKAFLADSLTALMFKITTSDAAPLETVDPLIPKEISTLVAHCMSKKPGDRYQKMEEIVRDLEAFAATIEERKARLQTATLSVLQKLEKLLLENKDLFQADAPELQNLSQLAPPLLRVVDGTYDENQSVTTWRPPQSYYYLQELGERASQEYDLLAQLIARRRQVQQRLSEASALLSGGRPEDALRCLQVILRDDPGDFRAVAMQKEAAARLEQQRLTQQKARQADEALRKAQEALQNGDLDACMGMIEDVLRVAPNHLLAVGLKDTVKQRLKERSELENNRQRSGEAFARAQAAFARQDYPSARSELESARNIYPQLPGLMELLHAIDKAEEETGRRRERERRSHILLQEARAFADQGETDSALNQLAELLAMDPQNLSARNLKQKLDKHIRAEELFQKATNVLSANDPTSCMALLKEVLNLRPDYSAARNLLEAVQQRMLEQKALEEKRRQSMEAISAARKALASGDLQRAREEADKARLLYSDITDVSETLKAIEEAEERKLKIARSLDNARMLSAAGEEELALAQIREVLSLEPSHLMALLLKKDIEMQRLMQERAAKERHARILALFRRAEQMEASGTPAEAATLSRAILSEDGDHQGALSLLERAEAILGKDKDPAVRKRDRIDRLQDLVNRAIQLRHFSQAIQALDEILRLDAAHSEAAAKRSQVLEAFEAEKALQARRAEGEREKRFGMELLRKRSLSEGLAALSKAMELLGEDAEAAKAIAEAQENVLSEHHRLQVRQWMEDAQKLLATEDFKGSRDKMRGVLDLLPGDARALDLLKRIEQAEEQKRRRAEVASHLAQSEQALGHEDFDTALKHAREVLLFDSHNEEARKLVERITASREEKNRRDRIASIYVQSQKALDQLNFDEASLRITELSLLDPQSPQAREMLAKIEKARAETNKRAKIAALLEQAEQVLTGGDLRRAELLGQDLLALEPSSQRAKDLLSRVALARKQLREKEQISALLAKCRSTMKQQQYEDAIACIRQALRMEPGNMEAESLLRQIRQVAPNLARELDKETGRAGLFTKKAMWALISGALIVVLSVVGYFVFSLITGSPEGEMLVRAEFGGPESFEVAILLNGEFIGMTGRGELRLTNIKPGSHLVTARKNGYKDQTASVAIRKGKNPDALIKMSAPSTEPGAILDVESGKPGCLIILDDHWFEKANQRGACVFKKVPVGNHCVRVKLDSVIESRAFTMKDLDDTIDFRSPPIEGQGPCPTK